MKSVRLESFCTVPFRGWLPVNADGLPPLAEGAQASGGTAVAGRVTGLDTRHVHMRVLLEPGVRQIVDLGAFQEPAEGDEDPAPLPPGFDPVTHFGGALRFANGAGFTWVSLDRDGVAVRAHLRRREAETLMVYDVYLLWYPGEPWARAEVVMTASNSAHPDRFATFGDRADLRFGDALTFVVGAGVNAPIAPVGTRFADGQERVIPLIFFWPRLARGPQDWASFAALMEGGLSARGIDLLLPDGNPRMPEGFSARQWAKGKLVPSVQRLHTWLPAMIGPNPTSGDTGEQEDQLFVRGECMQEDGGGCELVAYYNALRIANRPCQHLEPNGEPLDWRGHTNPRLVLWDMRPHWHPAVSPERLGNKGISPQDASGWWGADVEHALFNTLAAASRLTGSPALQKLLDQVARNYLFQWTVQPGLSTSAPFAARAYGWEGILCVHLWRGLEDRALAQAVADRWRARFDAFSWMLHNLDIRTDDPRLGPGQRWMPWQESVKAYGMDLAGAVLGRPQAREIARALAEKILDDAFVQVDMTDAPMVAINADSIPEAWHEREPVRLERLDEPGDLMEDFASPKLPIRDSLPNIWPLMQHALDTNNPVTGMLAVGGYVTDHVGQWTTKDVVAVDGAQVTVGFFTHFGCPLAPAVVLRHDVLHEKANSIWQQLVANSNELKETAWLAPGV